MSSRTRTSGTHPIRVDFVEGEMLGLPGRVGVTTCPGVRERGRWNRELESDLHRLKQHYGTDTIVALLEREDSHFIHGGLCSLFSLSGALHPNLNSMDDFGSQDLR